MDLYGLLKYQQKLAKIKHIPFEIGLYFYRVCDWGPCTSLPMLGPWFSNIHSQMVTKHALSSCPISCYEISQCIVALHTSKLLFIWYSPFLQNLESAWCWIVRQTRGWEMTIFSVIECDCYFLQFAILQDWLKKWTIFAKLYADLSFPQMP